MAAIVFFCSRSFLPAFLSYIAVMSLPLSVLDLSPLPAGSSGAQALRNSLDLAAHVDGLGFLRYWVSEHHNLPSVVSTSPEVLIGHLANVSRHLRVGSGGIMLPNHAPLRIVEAFRVLEALHPGRIDLGLGRAPGSDGRASLALRGSRTARGGDEFPEMIEELLAFAGQVDFPPGSPLRTVRALPDDVPLPPVWLLGSSDYGARLAARLGFGYAFAHHFSAEWTLPAARAYKEGFRPTPGRLTRSHLILTVSVVCAETDAEADRLAASVDLMAVRRAHGQFLPIASVEDGLAYPYSPEERAFVEDFRTKIFVGSPRTVRARLEHLAAETRADELMVSTVVHEHAARRRSYALLAEAFGLVGQDAGAWPQAA